MEMQEVISSIPNTKEKTILQYINTIALSLIHYITLIYKKKEFFIISNSKHIHVHICVIYITYLHVYFSII